MLDAEVESGASLNTQRSLPPRIPRGLLGRRPPTTPSSLPPMQRQLAQAIDQALGVVGHWRRAKRGEGSLPACRYRPPEAGESLLVRDLAADAFMPRNGLQPSWRLHPEHAALAAVHLHRFNPCGPAVPVPQQPRRAGMPVEQGRKPSQVRLRDEKGARRRLVPKVAEEGESLRL